MTNPWVALLGREADQFEAIVWSPDGRFLAAATDLRIWLWDPSSGRLLRTLAGQRQSVSSLAFSPNGTLLASGSYDGTVRLWQPQSGEPLRLLEGHESLVASLAFSPDGTLLASGSWDNTVRLWQFDSGRRRHRVLKAHAGSVNCVAFSPDGKILASGSDDQSICLWTPSSGRRPRILEAHQDTISSVAFSPDGETLASASHDRTIRFWEPSTGALLYTLQKEDTSSANCVAFSPDGTWLVSADLDERVRLWDRSSRQLVRTLTGHQSNIECVAFSPDSKTIASGSWDHTVRLWDTATGQLLLTLEGHSNLAYSAAVSPNGEIVATGTDDARVCLWDARTGALTCNVGAYSGEVQSVAFSPDGTILAFSCWSKVQLLSVQTGLVTHTLEFDGLSVYSVAVSIDGTLIASGTSDGAVWLWDASRGRMRERLKGHTEAVRTLAFSPNGKLLASGSGDGTIRLWRLRTGAQIRVLDGHTAGVDSITFSPDGNRLASGASDGTVRLWSIPKGIPIFTLEGHLTRVRKVAFSPDGSCLASLSNNALLLYGTAFGEIREHHKLPEGYKAAYLSHRGTAVVAPRAGDAKSGEPLCRLLELGSPSQRIASPAALIRQISAKLVLMGESNSGKSSLALRLIHDRYEEQGSTHGTRLWSVAPERVSEDMAAPAGEQREITIWDLGGQREYRLVHQLFLQDTTIALLFLDPTRGEAAYRDVEEWNLRLAKQSQGSTIKLLIGSKSDQWTEGLHNSARLRRLMSECGIAEFLPTSAKTGAGLPALRQAIARRINWPSLTVTSRPQLFQQIRDQINKLRLSNKVFISYRELERQIREQHGPSYDKEAVDTVVKQLGEQGVLVDAELSSGERILVLQIGYVEIYACSLVLMARDHSRGVPVLEVAALRNKRKFPGIRDNERLPPRDEPIVLECVVQLLLKRVLCIEHGGLLIFPTLFPDSPDPNPGSEEAVSLYYDFTGAIESIYSALVVELALVGDFGRVQLWKSRAEYNTADGALCGLRTINHHSGQGHLDLLFNNKTPERTRQAFITFVERQLSAKGVQVHEVLQVTCGCKFRFQETTVRKRLSEGRADIVCPECEHRCAISEGAQAARETDSSISQQLVALKTQIESRQKDAVQSVRQHMAVSQDADTGNTASAAPIWILHLSDLHFRADEDPIQRLMPLLQDLDDPEDGFGAVQLSYLVVTGDVTNRGSGHEFEKVHQFLDQLIKNRKLSPERCLIVPGNHDLSWDEPEDQYSWKAARFVETQQLEAGMVVKKSDGYLVRSPEAYARRFDNYRRFHKQLTQQDFPAAHSEEFSVLLFEETGIQFLGFNSAWEIDEHFPDRSGISAAAVPRALAEAATQVERAIAARRLHEDAPLLRIALLHHPIRGTEQIKDDAFLEQLRKSNVRLCLHGHVHEERTELVGYLHPRQMHVLGAGSFGAGQVQRPESMPRLYNLLEIDRDLRGVRVHTRCMKKTGGAWEGWAVWPNPTDKHSRRCFYEILL